jgi:hypothetical protein
MPKGNFPFEPTPVITGVGAAGGISVTVAVAVPFGPVAITLSVPVEDIADGAVYRPALVTVPWAAAQAVAPAEVNCCCAPRFNETVIGEMACAFRACNVTAAEADPPGPVAVTVTELDDGMTAGAVNRPLALMVPAVVIQAVAPEEVNCCVEPSLTVAVVGEIVCGEGGPLATNVALKTGPHNVPGFSTWNATVPADR